MLACGVSLWAADPAAGTWKLNPAKSKYTPGPTPQSATMAFEESADGIKRTGENVLPDGTKIEGPVGLRQILIGRKDQFVGTATERLLTYALGRGVEPSDMPAVRKIVRDAAAREYRWSSLIMGIIQSVPFQMRRARQS